MGLGDVLRLRTISKQAIVSVLLLIIASIQIIVYHSVYEPRAPPELNDVIIMSIISGVIFFLILIFERSLEKRSARIPLQLGWTFFYYAGVHSAIINLVDLSYPYSPGVWTDTLIQFYQDNLTLFLGAGVVISVIGIYNWVVDVAERERTFQSLVAAMPVGVAMLSVDGRVITHNHGLSQILQLDENQIQNMMMSDLLLTDVQSILKNRSGSSNDPVDFDVTLERDDGSKTYLAVSIVSNRERDGRITGHIAVVTDVTMRRRTAEEREQQRRVIDLYASLLSHDIGNDLQAVLGYVEGSLLLIDKDAPKAVDMLHSAQAAALRMGNLIKTFRRELTPSDIEIVPMLQEVASQAERVSMGMKVNVHVESRAANLRSPGGSLLPMAMDNLLRNAAEHAGSDVEVKIRVSVEDSGIIIIVSDNGPGIPKEKLRVLFNRSDPDSESGLGLYLTKQIVTACGGTIDLEEKELGTGASFKIMLPLVE